LGLLDDPAVQRELENIAEQTDALEVLTRRERDGAQPSRWWADGEYDDTRADAANDAGAACVLADACTSPPSVPLRCDDALTRRVQAGAACFARKEYHAAYDAWTEAIRLSPLKARTPAASQEQRDAATAEWHASLRSSRCAD
jgi:hypothetical protein